MLSMPGCALHVTGTQLDPQAVLSGLNLQPYLLFRKGDKLFDKVCEVGGFSCNVSASDGVLSQEIADAIGFLVEYEVDLRRLAVDSNVQKMSLDFGYHLRIDGERIIFQRTFCRQNC